MGIGEGIGLRAKTCDRARERGWHGKNNGERAGAMLVLQLGKGHSLGLLLMAVSRVSIRE